MPWTTAAGSAGHSKLDVPKLGNATKHVHRLFDEFIELDSFLDDLEPLRLGFRKQQQLVDQQFQAARLLDNLRQQLLVFLAGSSAGQGDFDAAANRGQRRSQFVCGIGEKVAAFLQVIADPVQQPIQRFGQTIEFVARSANLQSFV